MNDDEGCWWLDPAGRCHYEQVVIGLGGPCADCPEENDRIATLRNEKPATMGGG